MNMPKLNFTSAAAAAVVFAVLFFATAAAAADDSENTVRRGEQTRFTIGLETIQGGPSAPGLSYVDISSVHTEFILRRN